MLGSYRCHSEAKDKDNEDSGDGIKDHMDAEPHRSSRAEVAPCQKCDGESKANCYASESTWYGLIIT